MSTARGRQRGFINQHSITGRRGTGEKMVSWAAKKAKEHADKKNKEHEEKAGNHLQGTYYSNAEKEDVHREEKIIITEERTKHLNDLKQQILERNSKLSEIERRAFSEAHTPKKKRTSWTSKRSRWSSGRRRTPTSWPGKRNCKG